MRIVVHGQKAFGKALLERLLSVGENVVAVCSAPTKEGQANDPLVEFAREQNLPVYQPESWKTPEALELMKSLEAYVLMLVPEPVLNAPKFGTFQYHPSLLPYHRGPSAISWPIAMGETRTGLTIFWPNEGYDEGPILLTKSCGIEPNDTLGTVYFDKLFPMGIDAMIESLELVKAGIILKYDQDLSKGSYESWFTKEFAQVNWGESVEIVYNKIRAADPAPGAWSTINENIIELFQSVKDPRSDIPGEILNITDDGILISAKDGSILANKFRIKGGNKISGTELADTLSLKPGDKFEFDPDKIGKVEAA